MAPLAQPPQSKMRLRGTFHRLRRSDNAVGGYVGAGYAFGKGLYESGWRFRAVGSLGRYHYVGRCSRRLRTSHQL